MQRPQWGSARRFLKHNITMLLWPVHQSTSRIVWLYSASVTTNKAPYNKQKILIDRAICHMEVPIDPLVFKYPRH